MYNRLFQPVTSKIVAFPHVSAAGLNIHAAVTSADALTFTLNEVGKLNDDIHALRKVVFCSIIMIKTLCAFIHLRGKKWKKTIIICQYLFCFVFRVGLQDINLSVTTAATPVDV